MAEKMISLGKASDLHTKRQVYAYITKEDAVSYTHLSTEKFERTLLSSAFSHLNYCGSTKEALVVAHRHEAVEEMCIRDRC